MNKPQMSQVRYVYIKNKQLIERISNIVLESAVQNPDKQDEVLLQLCNAVIVCVGSVAHMNRIHTCIQLQIISNCRKKIELTVGADDVAG